MKDGVFVGDYWILDDQGGATVTGYLGYNGKYLLDVTADCGVNYLRPRDVRPDGTVVGYCQSTGFHGFILQTGITTIVDEPNSWGTFLSAIDSSGKIAGYACSDDECATTHAFLYDMLARTFQDIGVPGATSWYATGMNGKGEVVIGSDIGSFLYCEKRNCPRSSAIHLKSPMAYTDVKQDGRDPDLERELRLPFRP
jgi:hypothetical protein